MLCVLHPWITPFLCVFVDWFSNAFSVRNRRYLSSGGYLLGSFWALLAVLATIITHWDPDVILGQFSGMVGQKSHFLFGALLAHFLAHVRLMMHVSSFFWCTCSRICFSSILGGLKALKFMLFGGGRHGWSVVNNCRNWVGQVFIQGWFWELSGVPSRLTFWGQFGSRILYYRHFGATLGAFGG